MPVRGPDVQFSAELETKEILAGLKKITLHLDDVGRRLSTMNKQQRQQANVAVKGYKMQMQAGEKLIQIKKKEAQEQGKATAATRQSTQAIKSQNAAVEKSAHSFSSFSKAIGTSITLWYTARTAVYAVRNAIEETIGVYRKGASAIDEFRMSVIGASAIIGPRMEEGSTAAQKMGLALEFATDMMLKLELVAAKHIATGRSLQMVWEALAISGTIATDKDVENVAKLADLITLYTKGQRLEVQLMQEVRGLMDGQVRAQNKLAYTLDRILDGQLKEHLQMWRAMGRDQEGQLIILREIANLLGDIGSLEGEILATAQTWRNTLETVINRILRSGTAEYYKDLGTALREAATFLLDFNTGLTYQGHLVVDILTQGWERLKDVLEGILRMDFGDLGDEATKALEGLRRFLTEVDAKSFGADIRGAFNLAIEAADKFLDILKIIFIVRAPVWLANFARLMGLSVIAPIVSATGKMAAFEAAWAGFAIELGLLGTGTLAALGLHELSKAMDTTFTPEQKKGLEEYKAALDELGEAVIFSSTTIKGLSEETEDFTGMTSWIKGSLQDLRIIVKDMFDTFNQAGRELDKTEQAWENWLLDGIIPAQDALEELPPVVDDFADSVEGAAQPMESLGEAVEATADEMKRYIDISEDMTIFHKRLEQDVDSLNKSFQSLDVSEFRQSFLDILEFDPEALSDFQKSVEFTLKAVGETWETMSERTKELIEERLKVLIKILKEEQKAREKATREAIKEAEKAAKEKEKQIDDGLKAVIKYYAEQEELAIESWNRVEGVVENAIRNIQDIMEQQADIELEIMVDLGGAEALASFKSYLAERAAAYGKTMQAITKEDLAFVKKIFGEWKKMQEDIEKEWEKIWDNMWKNFQEKTGDIIYDFVTDFEGAWEDLADTMYDIFARLFSDSLAALITKLFKGLADDVGDFLGDIFKGASKGAEGILGSLGKLAGPIGGVLVGGIGMAVTSLFGGGESEEAQRQRERELELLRELGDVLDDVNQEWEDMLYGISEVEKFIRDFNKETRAMIMEFADIAHLPGVMQRIKEIESTREQMLAKLVADMAEDFAKGLELIIGEAELTGLAADLQQLDVWFRKMRVEAEGFANQIPNIIELLIAAKDAKLGEIIDAFLSGVRELRKQATEIIETTGMTSLQKELYDLGQWAATAADEIGEVEKALKEAENAQEAWTEELRLARAALDDIIQRRAKATATEVAAMSAAQSAIKSLYESADVGTRHFLENLLGIVGGSTSKLIKILSDYSDAQLRAQGFTEEAITAINTWESAQSNLNSVLSSTAEQFATLPIDIDDLNEALKGVGEVIGELTGEIKDTTDLTDEATQTMFDDIANSWKEGMRAIIDDATLTPYQKEMQAINKWYEDQTANIAALRKTAVDLGLSTAELDNAEQLLNVAYQARIDAAEDLKDSMVDASALVEDLMDIINKANMNEYKLKMQELIDTAERQAVLLADANEDTSLAWQALGILITELADEARAEIADFLKPIEDILARETLSSLGYQLYRVDQWLIDTLADAEGLADAADFLGVSLDEVIAKVRAAAAAQKESIIEAATERFFTEVQDVIDRFELTPYEQALKDIAGWEQDMIDLADELGLSTEDIARAVAYLREEAEDLIDIPIGEDFTDQIAAIGREFDDIVAKNTLGDIGYQMFQLDLWAKDTEAALRAMMPEGEELDAMLDRLTEAYNLQADAINRIEIEDFTKQIEGLNAELDDIIAKHTLDDVGYQLFRLEVWALETEAAIRAVAEGEELTDLLAKLTLAIQLQEDAITGIIPDIEDLTDEIEDFNASLEDIIARHTLSDMGYEIYRLNQWYEEQRLKAIELGQSLDLLNEAYDRQLRAIRLGPIEDLLENVTDFVTGLQRADWGAAEYTGLFGTLMSTFANLDKNSEDYYETSIDILTKAFGALRSIEGLQKQSNDDYRNAWQDYRDQLERYHTSIRDLQSDITSAIFEFLGGGVSPAQSYEAVQAEYERLYRAARQHGDASEVAQRVSEFIAFAQGPYADFMAAYGDNYAAVADEIVKDLKSLRDWVAGAIDRPQPPQQPTPVEGEVSIISSQWQTLIDVLTKLLQETESTNDALLTIVAPGGDIKIDEPIVMLPTGQHGGLMSGPTIGGEKGPEWFVPTYEPEKSRFLQDVGASPEVIADALADKLGPMLGSSRALKLVMDSREVASIVIDQVSRSPDLIQKIRRIVSG